VVSTEIHQVTLGRPLSSEEPEKAITTEGRRGTDDIRAYLTAGPVARPMRRSALPHLPELVYVLERASVGSCFLANGADRQVRCGRPFASFVIR